MAKRFQIYRCNICGNIVEVLEGGAGQLVCCGQPMELLAEKTQDEGKEKHVPIAENTEDGLKIIVGADPHPMEDKHYIQWIEVITDGRVFRKYLAPGEKPETDFKVFDGKIEPRIYCNIHGLWKS